MEMREIRKRAAEWPPFVLESNDLKYYSALPALRLILSVGATGGSTAGAGSSPGAGGTSSPPGGQAGQA